MPNPPRHLLRAFSLESAISQRMDNSHDMGNDVSRADAVGYWIVRFAHEEGAAEELEENWEWNWETAAVELGLPLDRPLPNPWAGFPPMGDPSQVADVLAMLRQLRKWSWRPGARHPAHGFRNRRRR